MIAASRRVGLLALVMAASLHLGGLMRWDMSDPIDVAGGEASAPQASLGDAFDDLSSGTVTPVQATEVIEQVEPTSEEVMPPTEEVTEQPPIEPAVQPDPPSETPEPLDTAEPAKVPEPVTTAEAELPTPVAPAPMPELTVTENATVPLVTASPESVTTKEPAQLATPRVETLAALTPTRPITPVDTPQPDPEPIQPPPPETVTAEDQETDGLAASLRPRERPPELERQQKRAEPIQQPRPTAAAPAGNAQTSATTGQRNADQSTERNRQTSGAARNTEAGNAAVSNYPGQVARKIQRVRRPRMSSRGAAQVSFRVADNGGLSALGVSQTSGSNRLDDAALTIVRSAAPFPAPPPGAQRSFRIKIEFN